jgi:hypothetical protein
MHAGFFERLPVMRDVAIGVIERPFQPLELKRPDLIP